MSEAVKPKENKNQPLNENPEETVLNHEPEQEISSDDNNESENIPEEDAVAEAIVPEKEEIDYNAVIDDLNDKILRTAAEMQNAKRRAEQDIQKARDYSIEAFARDMLGVMDNLHRTTESISQEDAAKDEKLKLIIDGIDITKKEMENVFERNKIKCINPVGEKFDHNFHQAMSQIEDAEKDSGTIVNVMQTGYVIKDRLIRPALVVTVK
ncbi:MAG: nucleotide exchange factor GrpE [Alphaproteobacteria bacterium CG11_big_fil_rev_8_21_14_0_20_39_49]|nr:MAG: nucleotide exchange factor GrpE [Alphaproteobacteria bacterium CG11_big_fil_rev_8_21_14_0_20_39_49]